MGIPRNETDGDSPLVWGRLRGTLTRSLSQGRRFGIFHFVFSECKKYFYLIHNNKLILFVTTYYFPDIVNSLHNHRLWQLFHAFVQICYFLILY